MRVVVSCCSHVCVEYVHQLSFYTNSHKSVIIHCCFSLKASLKVSPFLQKNAWVWHEDSRTSEGGSGVPGVWHVPQRCRTNRLWYSPVRKLLWTNPAVSMNNGIYCAECNQVVIFYPRYSNHTSPKSRTTVGREVSGKANALSDGDIPCLPTTVAPIQFPIRLLPFHLLPFHLGCSSTRVFFVGGAQWWSHPLDMHYGNGNHS